MRLGGIKRVIFTSWIYLILGLVVSFVLLGPLLNSKIALVDENDIPQYMGKAGEVKISQIPAIVWGKTEVGEFGKGPRFRPVYYLVRVTETALWGSEGAYWYGFRIFLFGIVIGGLWWLCIQAAGPILGSVVVAFTLSFRMWDDIWARSTGPSEQYAAVGFVLFAIGAWLFVKRWQDGTSLRSAAVLLAAGGIIAMGSKENMLFLEVPLAVTLLAGLWRRRLDALSAIVLILSLVAGAWIASSIAFYFTTAKIEDIYGNTVGARLLTSKWMIVTYGATVAVILTICLTDRAILRYFGKEKRLQYRAISRKCLICYFAVVLVFVFQLIFYTGQMPTGGRYDLPGVLALPALLLLLCASLSETAGLFVPYGTVRRIVGSMLALGLLIYMARANWTMPAAVAANVERTTVFDASLRQTRLRADEKPDWPIVVASFNPWDAEVVQTLGVLFIAKGIVNPRFLVHVGNIDSESRTPFERDVLNRLLQDQSRDGMAARGYLPLNSYGQYKKSGCFLIALRQADRLIADGNSGRLPDIVKDCEYLPMRIYWAGNTLKFELAETGRSLGPR